MKVKVLTSASRASIKVKNLDRRRKILNFVLAFLVVEHAALAWAYEREFVLEAAAKLAGLFQ